MSFKIDPELKKIYPFLQLNAEERKALPKQLMYEYEKNGCAQSVFSGRYLSVFEVMKGGKQVSQLTSEELQLLNEVTKTAQTKLDDKKVTETHVEKWKVHKDSERFKALKDILSLGVQASVLGAVVPVGMTFLYLRSHKILALASACAACACFVFGSAYWKLSNAFEKHYLLIQALNVKNFAQFSQKVNDVYENLKKTNYLMRFYLNAHQSRMNNSLGWQFLQEQLIALGEINSFIKKQLISSSHLPLIPVKGKVKLDEVKPFFTKFEAFCQKGLMGTVGMGLIALAGSYYAYMQKARLMVIAGMVYSLGLLIISRELYILQSGSRKIHLAQESQIESQFQEMATQSFLLRRKGLQNANESQIQDAVLVSFEAILKLIPSWKS